MRSNKSIFSLKFQTTEISKSGSKKRLAKVIGNHAQTNCEIFILFFYFFLLLFSRLWEFFFSFTFLIYLECLLRWFVVAYIDEEKWIKEKKKFKENTFRSFCMLFDVRGTASEIHTENENFSNTEFIVASNHHYTFILRSIYFAKQKYDFMLSLSFEFCGLKY